MTKVQGSRDELETIQIVVSSNKVLLQKVLDRIRQIKAQGKETVFEAAKKTRDKNREDEEKKAK